MKISEDGLRIIQHYESCQLEAYKCPAGIWTIGYGHTGQDVKPGMVISPQRAEELLRADIASFERDVQSLVKVFVTQRQFDALVCFAFNVGSDIDADTIAEGLGDSTLLKKVNAGEFKLAAEEFLKWDKADGSHNRKDDDGDGLVDEPGEKQRLKGLTRRAHSQRALFLGASGNEAIQIGLAAA